MSQTSAAVAVERVLDVGLGRTLARERDAEPRQVALAPPGGQVGALQELAGAAEPA